MSSHSPSRSAASSAGTVNERECAVCGKRAPCRPVRSLRPSLVRKLQEHGLAANSPHAAVCTLCLSSALSKHTLDVVKHRKKGELPEVEKELTARATEIADEVERGVPDSLGLRAADAVARIGGSWGFVLGFMVVIAGWAILNSLILAGGFDPYPYILLNLVLSCLASIQAPIILMSQSRMAQVDRIRATEDFRINLKAELEVAALHEKMDHLLHQQWDRLLELQEVQLAILEELRGGERTAQGKGEEPPPPERPAS